MTLLVTSAVILVCSGLIALICNRGGECGRGEACVPGSGAVEGSGGRSVEGQPTGGGACSLGGKEGIGWATWMGLSGCLVSGVLGSVGAVLGLLDVSHGRDGGVDGYTCLFALPVLLVGMGAALHAVGYMRKDGAGRHGYYWCFFNLMLASMLCVCLAQNRMSFLVFWELMGLFSFALVAFEYGHKGALKAAWGYLLACQAGGLLLILLNALHREASGPAAWGLLVAGMVAFGLKAGFPGLHVWLPEAHPAAPAPVSAVMSGAMIPLGFLGILRMLHIGSHLLAAGWILLICGSVAAPAGILLASAQNNLKRLLAYSSVENMGVISMGLGLGLLGLGYRQPAMVCFGFSGALLHVLNHAFLKGTLFLGAGSVLRATGSLSIDGMGGLLKRMGVTGRLFTASAISLCGLPPFNGFLGEFLIYYGAFCCVLGNCGRGMTAGACLVILSLALTGGLAAAVYAKAVGGVFLGEPRTKAAVEAHDVSPFMWAGMWFLSACSVLMLAVSPLLFGVIGRMLKIDLKGAAGNPAGWLLCVCIGSLMFLFVIGFVVCLRRILPRGKEETEGPTWDCGYARPTARMAYTGTALTQPILDYFGGLLHLRREGEGARGLFPERADVKIKTEDVANCGIWRPLCRMMWKSADMVHRLQTGSLHFYILIMVMTLLIVLVCAFGFGGVSQEVVK